MNALIQEIFYGEEQYLCCNKLNGMSKSISGFSKLSKSKKIDWIVNTYFSNAEDAKRVIKQYWSTNDKLQQLHDEFIENTITNYYLPLSVAPNFLINNKLYTIPMAIEES